MSVRTDTVNLIVNVGGDKAKDALNQLRKEAADLSAEMKGLKKGSAEYIAKQKELKAVTTDMDKLRKSIGLTAMTQKELVQELNRLKAIRGSLTPQTKEFDEFSRKIKDVEKRLYDVRNGVFGFQSTLSKIGSEIKQFGLLAAGYLGFEFITDAFRNILTQSGKVSDKLADVRRVTGQSQSEVESLLSTFRNFDTRTATSQLLDYAKIAGKLGIASGEIASFVKATDQLVTALGDELGDADTITENIGKIINIYDKGAQVTGQRTLQIGNAIVDLANKGVASGNFIVDFTKRLAGIANTANVSLEASIGLAAGLEELGQTSETSSTAVTQLITKIGGDVPKYAALAGQSAKQFGDTLRNSPVEALLQLAEGLTKNKSGFAEIAVAFKDAEASGVRVTSTLGVLGQKADFLRGKISDAGIALTGTDKITEAFRLKNETLGATLDKIGKKIAGVFTSREFLDGLKSMAEHFAWLIGATNAAEDAIGEFHAQVAKVNSLEKEMIPLLGRYDELKSKTDLSKKEQVELNKVIESIARNIPSAVTQFDNYGNAIAISTEKAKDFIRIQKLMLREKNREAIVETKEVIAGLERQLKMEQGQFQRFSRELISTTEIQSSLLKAGIAPTKEGLKHVEFYTKGLDKVKGKISEINNSLEGQKAILAELTGDNLIVPGVGEKEKKDPEKLDPNPISPLNSDEVKKKMADKEKALQEHLERVRAKIADLQFEVEQMGKSADEQEHARITKKYQELIKEAMGFSKEILEIEKLRDRELEFFANKAAKNWDKISPIKSNEQLVKESIGNIQKHAEASQKEVEKLMQDWQKRNKQIGEDAIADLEKIKDLTKDAIMDSINMLQSMFSDLYAMLDSKEKKALDRDRKSNEERKRYFDKMLQHKQISQKQYDQETARLEAEMDTRDRDFMIKRAKRAKQLALITAIINGAISITEIWAKYGEAPYVAAILTAISAAAVGVQIAAIQSQEVPEAERGMLIKGKRHRDGGTLVEAEDGEVILSRNTVSNNTGVVNDLLYNSMYRNGAPIDWGWSNPTISTGRVIPKMERGGAVSDTTATTAQMAALTSKVDYLTTALSGEAAGSSGNTPPLRAYVVLRDIKGAQATYDQLRKNSGLNQ